MFCLLIRKSQILLPISKNHFQVKTFFDFIFTKRFAQETNRYKPERVQILGPDFACLEWLMEHGTTNVIMSDGSRIKSIRQMRKFLKKHGFNVRRLPTPSEKLPELLPSQLQSMIEKENMYVTRWANAKPIYIHEVDATDSAIGYDGFKFFRECRELRVLKLNYCEYFDDEAFRHLAYGRPKNTLNELEIITNGSVSEGIVKWITELKELKRLHLYLLPRIRNRNAFVRQVQLALPQCNITFPEADKFGYGYNVKQ